MNEVDSGIIIGQRIKKARLDSNLSQYELSQKTGISTTQISSYENGKRAIGLNNLASIAQATNKSLDEFCFGNSSEKPVASARNRGELIVNCFLALIEEGVVSSFETNDFYNGKQCEIYVAKYFDILKNLLDKLDDFYQNKENYPDPDGFKRQILAASINQINKQIEKED